MKDDSIISIRGQKAPKNIFNERKNKVATHHIVAGAGMKATEWETAVSGAMTVLAEETNRISHILQEKHFWEYIASSPSWETIRTIVNDVMLYGTDVILCNGKPGKELLISGEIVQIQYAVVEGVLKIVNGWIAK